jgi:hypothetical protein
MQRLQARGFVFLVFRRDRILPNSAEEQADF